MFRLNKKDKIYSKAYSKRGMTYVELIVVMGIFSVITSIVLFDYGKFQSKVDIKNLANDLALKFVETQKSSLAGKQSNGSPVNWKPSYGLYFNLSSPGNNKSFIYFADLDSDKKYNVTDLNFCVNPAVPTNDECLDKTTITKNNYISEIRIFYTTGVDSTVTNLATTFTRPNSGADFASGGALLSNVFYAQVTVLSPKGSSAVIKLYASGRIQIN